MITLDELIKDLEDGTPYLSAVLISKSTHADALHYLKDYRDKWHSINLELKENETLRDRLSAEIEKYQEAVKNCEAAENRYKKAEKQSMDTLWKIARQTEEENIPLTWDDMRKMEGKPIWIEVFWDEWIKGWVLVKECFEDQIQLVDESGTTFDLFRYKQGEMWNAYRKEKE